MPGPNRSPDPGTGATLFWSMTPGILRTARFARHWYRPEPGVLADEVVLPGDAGSFETTRLRPGGPAPASAWILLHGITRPGRRHPVLVRFARALAGTGAVVLIPEIPEWTALDLAPAPARQAVLAALTALEDGGEAPRRIGLIGFSFGAPQAIRLAADPQVGPRLACAAGFGGYGTLERALAFLWSGRHDWEGRSYRTRPDPYGRWVVAANFLTRVPGHEGAGEVASALRSLAATAGDLQVPSWDPALDGVKDRLERGLAPEERPLFRRFAPPATAEPPGDPDEWSRRLARAAVSSQPELDLPPRVRSPIPVVLIHGRGDALVPFSETLRLAGRIDAPRVEVAVTGLFEHSDEARAPVTGRAKEFWRLGRTLSSLLGTV